MAEVKDIITAGEKLGLEGQKLKDYVTEQQNLERDRRAFERDMMKIKENEMKIKENEMKIKENEMKLREKELAEAEAERNVKERLELERLAGLEADRVLREKIEAEKMKLEEQRLALEREKMCSGSVAVGKTKLPPFNEDKDKFDSYISRFESYAAIRKWKRSEWSLQLSLLLTGKALDTFYGLSDVDQKNYDRVKEALLRRYLLTEDEYRKQFFFTKVEVGETPSQFITRTSRLFDKWVESTKITQDYQNLRSLMVREQFLRKCHADLAAYLREKKIHEISELAETTQRYLDAHGGTMFDRSRDRKKGEQKASVSNPKTLGKGEEMKLCGICKKGGHREENCWFKKEGASSQTGVEQKGSIKRCFKCRSTDHVIKDCPRKNEVGSVALITDECSCVKTHKGCICVCEVLRDVGVEANTSNVVEKDGRSYVVHDGSCEKSVKICKCSKFPISKGSVNDTEVVLMRDSGCSSVVVSSKLVETDQYTGEYKDCMLIDGTVRRLPVAVVNIDCVYVRGRVEALVVKTPVFDLIIGNAPRVVGVEEKMDAVGQVDTECRGEKLVGHESCGEGQEIVSDSSCQDECASDKGEVAAAVVTRQQAKASKQPLKPLLVACGETVEKDIVIQNQKGDPSLAKYWKFVGVEKARETKSGVVRFETRKGVLYRVFTPRNGGRPVKQLVVPEEQRLKVLTVSHEGLMSGHCGIRRTTERVLSNFFWPGVNTDIVRHVRSCDICQKTAPKGKQGRAPLVSMPVVKEPFKRVSVDLIGPIVPCSERGHRYILTVTDYATRYPEAVPLKNIDTITVAEALLEIYTRLGFPEELQSDRGTQFLSDIMQEVERLLSIKHVATTPYHPQCNGLVEHLNGTLKVILKKLCNECPKQWDRYLPAVLFAYRSTEQESTGFSPFELMFGRKVRGPMELLRQYWTQDETDEDGKPVYKYVVDLKQRLHETCELAQEALADAQKRQKMYYDRKARPKSLKIGSKVLLLLPVKRNKLLLQWRGPYTVLERMSTVNYRIQVGRKVKNFHVNMLKPYVERSGDGDKKVVGMNIQPELVGGVETSDYVTSDSGSVVESLNDFSEDEQDEALASIVEMFKQNDGLLSNDVSGGPEILEQDDVLSDDVTSGFEGLVQNEMLATAVVNDFDRNDDVDHEMIHVCPISSDETIADVKVNPDLTPEQKKDVQNLLEEFSDIFTTLPGCTNLVQHEIKLTTDEPIRAKSYPLPYSMRDVIDQEIDQMLKMDVIRPSKSPYAAPPVIVKKPDGSNRFCVNFMKLNSYTVFDSEPMPDPEAIYMKMKGKKYRSKVDCSKGYWQILMHPDSIEKTCFCVMGNRHQGAFEFLRMPFGLQNSAASFNRLMRKVCTGLDDVDSFVDDVEVANFTWSEHLLALRKFFTRMRESGLTAKPSKCLIGYCEMEYVGHDVELDTLKPREAKCSEILAVERPRTKRQVQSFLAMIGYYARFIPRFADVAEPLTALVKKQKPNVVDWGDSQQRAFAELKRRLSTAPVLVIADCTKTMYVQTDASDVGLGACLLQEHKGTLHPVRFLSRKLKDAEKQYSTIEKEGLAIVWAIQKLAVFLYGVEFVLLTDHRPLTFIQQTKMKNARVMRWSLFLQDWSFIIKSIKGVDNIMADYLSRA